MVGDYHPGMSSVDPLVAPLPSEVPLQHAPLVRVIAQLRFPEILSVEERGFVAPFQEAIRKSYPVLRPEQTQGVVFGPEGAVAAKPTVAWRFHDTEGHWRVSLAPDFVSLETTKYVSRADFLSRMESVTRALGAHVAPAQIDRLGVRYIDRVTGNAVDEINELVRPEVRGISGTLAGTHATHSISESVFSLEDSRLMARWGFLPPGVTVDPAAVEPSPEKSWILDLDMSSVAAIAFDSDRVMKNARYFSERIYTFFRWAVTDAFLKRYGGNP